MKVANSSAPPPPAATRCSEHSFWIGKNGSPANRYRHQSARGDRGGQRCEQRFSAGNRALACHRTSVYNYGVTSVRRRFPLL